jgi:hypothetical protein
MQQNWRVTVQSVRLDGGVGLESLIEKMCDLMAGFFRVINGYLAGFVGPSEMSLPASSAAWEVKRKTCSVPSAVLRVTVFAARSTCVTVSSVVFSPPSPTCTIFSAVSSLPFAV